MGRLFDRLLTHNLALQFAVFAVLVAMTVMVFVAFVRLLEW
jgi:hypothetical protein